ncbi:transcription factor SRM1-like isoform X2 [Phragmites australis]|nr:transcription factor SRM1-like isoform X2 [Phragmites australis]XP_062198480.1 transcription factor SRM1-like isoform X2 [Phragmites australis]XP_062198481.1 transcription factor SRM1-like isoform X2 [Phragmites australis]XP_062198482.1 transcription factor SRM1-like isoform X2 [Phragmites australis]XP_062198483.1 transcription factor SRM1-like isoform X2 [Phragmites australis]XP_062198484.1 transcription factor SRM1-like isoform X2 [Phragmites australis]
MDPMAIQEWTSCEVEEFKALIAKIRNEKSCNRMEALAKRFPAKTMQQLSDQYVEVFAEMLCDDIDDEPSSDDAIIDLNDWYKLLEGDTHDSLLGPSVETPLNQPSKLLVVEAEGNQMKMQRSHCKSTDKRRRFWTAEEHRQFLRGVQRLGRGEWKAISRYFVPSKTPVQLASHAQKFFKRMKQNETYDKRQRYSINDVKLVNHDLRIPPPIPTEDMDFLDDLAQGMPSFGLAGYSPTKLERQMALSNHILESLRWEVSSTPSPIEQGSDLLDQTGGISIENMNHPSRRKRTNRSRKNNKRVLPGALTARTPPEVLPSGQGSNSATNFTSEMAPNNQYNLHPTMPPF